MKFIFQLLVSVSLVFAHGVRTSQVQGAIGLQVFYDDGAPMSQVDVSVFAPSGVRLPFQTGISDEHGVFCFKPDEPGEWTIVFDDGLGHGCREQIMVAPNLELQKEEDPHDGHHDERFLKMIAGLSILFGVIALLYANKVKAEF